MAFDTRLLANLNVLAAVLQAGNFVRAGELLGLSQPAVSRAIQRLEERLQIRLFERSSKAMRLTDEGARFCQQTLPILTRLEEVVDATESSANQVHGHLRVNVNPAFGRLVQAIHLAGFLRKYPALELELIARDHLGDLVTEGFDVAIHFGRQEATTLAATKVLEARVITCASPEYIERRGHPRQPESLVKDCHDCLLLRNPATGQPFSWDFVRGRKRLASLPVRGRLIVNDAYTYLEACMAGIGVAQLLHVGIDGLLKAGKIVELFPDWPDEHFPLWAYHPARQFIPAKSRALLEFLRSLAGVQPRESR